MEGGENPDDQQTSNINTGNNVEQNQTKQSIDDVSAETDNTQLITSNQVVAPETIEQTVNQLAENAANTDQTAEPVLPHEKMIEELEKEAPVKQTNHPAPQVIKKERKLIKLFRIVVWLLVAVALPVGVSLRARSESIESFADGTSSLKLSVGNTIFYIALVVGGLNLIWGIVRWVLRIKRKHCTVGRVIGKLIGGGIWRTAVFTPIIITSLLFFSSVVNRWVEEKYNADQEAKITSSQKIEEDFNSGAITKDEYARNLLYASFDMNSLPEKYNGASDTFTPDFTSIVSKNFDELSDETLYLYYQITTLNNVKLGTNVTNEDTEETAYLPSIFSSNAYADEGPGINSSEQIKTLNKVIMSENNKFVIFYTDSGEDKISDEDAKKVGKMLEEDLDNYKNYLGLDYAYEMVDFDNSAISGSQINERKKFLRENGIDENALSYAMPVYVVTRYDDNTANAFYVDKYWADILKNIIKKNKREELSDVNSFCASVSSFPFIQINPNKINNNTTKMITAHELGHHYQSIYLNYNLKASDDVFVSEGSAHLMTINTTRFQDLENILNERDYNESYLREKVEVPIDEVGGYPSVAWFENLYELSGSNITQILELLKNENELEAAKNSFGEDILRKTMIQLAERNLTSGYPDYISFRSKNLPNGDLISCLKIVCSDTISVDRSALQYKYINTESINYDITINPRNEFIKFSVLGENDYKWEVIKSGEDSIKLEGIKELGYRNLAIVGINYSTNQSGSFDIRISDHDWEDENFFEIEEGAGLQYESNRDNDNGTEGADITGFEILNNIDSKENNINDQKDKVEYDLIYSSCSILDVNELLDIPSKILNAGSSIVEEINNVEGEYSDSLLDWNKNAENVRNRTEETKEQLSNYQIELCINPIKKNTEISKIKKYINRISIWSTDVFSNKTENGQIDIVAGIETYEKTGNVYLIVREDDDIELVTLKVEEK